MVFASHFKNVFIILFLFFFTIGCHDDNNVNPIDYRDKYIGKFSCNKTGIYHCGDSTYYYDTIPTIVVVSKIGDSSITIIGATLTIHPNGTFGGGLTPHPPYDGMGGTITNDTLTVITRIGGLGCFTDDFYTGKKI